MKGRDKGRSPKLLWEALLVLAPTLLLAGIGFGFLRQNRIWAEREGAALAHQAANDLALIRVPNALRSGPPPFDPLASRRLKRLEAQSDPVLEFSSGRHPRIAVVVDEHGGLIFPPPVAEWPTPRPLSAESLPPALQDKARALLKAGDLTQASSNAADQIRLFLAQSPPREFAGLGFYRLGRLLEASGEYAQARRQYEIVMEQFPDVLAESGIPLKTFSGLRLTEPEFLSTSTAGQRAGLLSWLSAEALFRPTPLSSILLRKLGSLGDQADLVKSACRIWAAHEKAREVYEELSGQITSLTTNPGQQQTLEWKEDNAGATWLVIPGREGLNRWLIFVNDATARKLVNEAVVSYPVPSSFRVAIDLAGRPLIPPPAHARALASVTTEERLNSSLTGVRASVYLTDPKAFYARVRVQTVWMSTVILFSILAVIAGLSSARRSYFRQRQLVEMKSNFVSSISHELRAPIASMRLLAEELVDSVAPPQEKQAEYHRLIVRECKRVSELIENVLDFSRNEQGREPYRFAATDLDAVVDDVLNVMRPVAAERQIRLEYRIDGQPVPVDASAKGLKQALLNLVDNAVKYSPVGATVSVGVDFLNVDPDRNIGAQIWVEDVGKGIPLEEQGRIFEPFYRCGSELTRDTQGVGLGLTIVQQIMHAHRGEVMLRSTIGQGSRFILVLPSGLKIPKNP